MNRYSNVIVTVMITLQAIEKFNMQPTQSVSMDMTHGATVYVYMERIPEEFITHTVMMMWLP